MTKDINIEIERQNHGDWINIYIPYPSDEKMFGSLQNEHGEIVKKVTLKQGNNSIDISSIKSTSINLKVETAYQTILKKLKLSM
ncbi:MAG: hypothetical protein ABIO79_15270 [Ferruginibacter sp.]